MKKLILGSLFLLLSSCSNPFGNKPVLETIADQISELLGGTTAEMVSGGTNNFVTTGGYKVTASVGNYATQNTSVTASGYKVTTDIKAE